MYSGGFSIILAARLRPACSSGNSYEWHYLFSGAYRASGHLMKSGHRLASMPSANLPRRDYAPLYHDMECSMRRHFDSRSGKEHTSRRCAEADAAWP